MLIPLLCASGAHVQNLAGYELNYYIGNGIEANSKGVEQLKNIPDPQAVKMVHLISSHDTAQLFALNEEYLSFLASLGRVGLTVHFSDNPRTPVQRNIWFERILALHFKLPEAVFYVENSHHDLFDLVETIMILRQSGIEAYMLLDTCHLEMDKNDALQSTRLNYSYKDLFRQFSHLIGGFHVSASQGAEGYAHDTHGKPIRCQRDEEFFRSIIEAIAETDFTHDVYIIPEINEPSYNKGCLRKNGIKAYNIIKEYADKANLKYQHLERLA